MLRRLRSILIGVAAVSGLISTASAVPITYTFVTGPQSLAYGTGVGLLPAGVFASGFFTYDNEGAYVASGTNGAGSLYRSLTNFSINVGAFSAFDAVGYSFSANDLYYTVVSNNAIVPRNEDLIELYAGPTGGAWTPFSVGGHELARVRLFWLEGLLGAPDLLTDESLPSYLPSFQGRLALDFGPAPAGSFPAGIVWFDGLYVSPVAVAEPSTLWPSAMGILALVLVMRKRVTVELIPQSSGAEHASLTRKSPQAMFR